MFAIGTAVQLIKNNLAPWLSVVTLLYIDQPTILYEWSCVISVVHFLLFISSLTSRSLSWTSLNVSVLMFMLFPMLVLAQTTFRLLTSPGRKIVYRNCRHLNCQIRLDSRFHSVFFAKWSQELCNSLSHFLQLSGSVQHHMTVHLPLSHSSERSHLVWTTPTWTFQAAHFPTASLQFLKHCARYCRFLKNRTWTSIVFCTLA